ncbi:MAG: hypothetical protein JNM89_16810 [Hyphomicrobiaceae bacterium]|nr:hypothetical protein [Hyphomicrobiaceae bacterium]
MTRTILTLAAALVAGLAPLATTAEAGGCGGGLRGYGKYMSYSRSYARDYDDEDNYSPRRSRSAAAKSSKVKAAAATEPKAQRSTDVASKAEDTAAQQPKKVAAVASEKISSQVAKAENTVSSVVASAIAVAENAVDTRELGCKRFVPAAGISISVKCE